MVRHYEKIPGTRSYKNYSDEDLTKALDAIKSGMPVKRAAVVYKIPRITLRNKSLGRHQRSVGHPSVLTSGEQVIRVTLCQVAKWGFPLCFIFSSYMPKDFSVTVFDVQTFFYFIFICKT